LSLVYCLSDTPWVGKKNLNAIKNNLDINNVFHKKKLILITRGKIFLFNIKIKIYWINIDQRARVMKIILKKQRKNFNIHVEIRK